MPTYIVLMEWTDQGARAAKDTVERRDRAEGLADKHGAAIERVYWTVGPHDLVAVVQAPDDESIAAMMVELGSGGNLRTLTMRAFDREEMAEIVQRIF